MCTKRVLFNVTIFAYLKIVLGFQLQVPRPDTVMVPVPFDLLENIQWSSNTDQMQSTCGTFEAYKGSIDKIVGRWYTIYVSNFPTETDYCCPFTNVQQPCGCLGIDFTTGFGRGITSFVMFSSNSYEKSVTYEIVTASTIGKSQFNINQIVLRSIVVRNDATVLGKGGYIIPNGVVVDSDNFSSYMIIMFCKEKGVKPIIMVLVNALPMTQNVQAMVFKYFKDKDIHDKLLKIDHDQCKHARNIVGY